MTILNGTKAQLLLYSNRVWVLHPLEMLIALLEETDQTKLMDGIT